MVFSLKIDKRNFVCTETKECLDVDCAINGWTLTLHIPYENPLSIFDDEALVKSWSASTGIPLKTAFSRIIHKYRKIKEKSNR